MEPHAVVAVERRQADLVEQEPVRRERAGRDRGDLRHPGRERAGDLPLRRGRVRHEPEDLAARDARGDGGPTGRTPREARPDAKQMFFTTGHRPRTLQRVALGATTDGRLTSLIHEGTGETSRYEQFTEALLSASIYMLLPERAHAVSAGTARHRNSEPHARARRGQRDLRPRMRCG